MNINDFYLIKSLGETVGNIWRWIIERLWEIGYQMRDRFDPPRDLDERLERYRARGWDEEDIASIRHNYEYDGGGWYNPEDYDPTRYEGDIPDSAKPDPEPPQYTKVLDDDFDFDFDDFDM